MPQLTSIIQLVGLIVAAFAICRLMQTAFQMGSSQQSWKGLSHFVRFIIVASVSVIGIIVIVALSVCLIIAGSPRPHAGGF